MPDEPKLSRFQLDVPIATTAPEEGQLDLKVVARDAKGKLHARPVRLDAKGQASVRFDFPTQPGTVQLVLGPAETPDEDLFRLQTVAAEVSARAWGKLTAIKAPVLHITPHFWHWWRRWCRTFVVRGRVLCANGTPVPGAEVCAYDIDAWWWWSSRQNVGCDTTDANGNFEIRFRWCCGWHPWWWWRLREWRLEPTLANEILPALQSNFRLGRSLIPSPRPSFKLFRDLLGSRPENPREAAAEPPSEKRAGTHLEFSHDNFQARSKDLASTLESLQPQLARILPRIDSLERLRLWPWAPWRPWLDCNPDLIFRVTQACGGETRVIVDESPWETRWNVAQELGVTLVANDQVCCLVNEPDPEGACVVLTHACGVRVDNIGGNLNLGAPATPAGYANPGQVDASGDAPFGGSVALSGLFGNLASVDYYGFEWFDESDALDPWKPLPDGALAGFYRSFYGPSLTGTAGSFHNVPFLVQALSGQRVIESRQHFEANNAPGTWGPGHPRQWIADGYFLLGYWLTTGIFADGTYRLRLVGWNEVDGALTKRRVLPLCNTEQDNEIVLTIDNRFVGPGSGHAASSPDHPCGAGTVHTCTLEPDTDFLAVRIGGQDAKACANIDAKAGGSVEIDFLAEDPDGHLGYYTLMAYWGENQSANLLALLYHPDVSRRATLSSLSFVPDPIGPDYGDALGSAALGQGATSPYWRGGRYRLTIPHVLDAFPTTCCYQLELIARKRTIVSCNPPNTVHTNTSTYSFMVVV